MGERNCKVNRFLFIAKMGTFLEHKAAYCLTGYQIGGRFVNIRIARSLLIAHIEKATRECKGLEQGR